jgi:hypothetical protein
MKEIPKLLLVQLAGALAFSGAITFAAEDKTQGPTDPVKVEEGLTAMPGVRIRNLEIFALVGPDQNGERDYLTLSEAMEKKVVSVQETGSVGELKIENKSPDRYVFIQAGEIVKGGQQDRCLKNDLVLEPKSGPQPIGSFCVEQSRWTRRGNESTTAFSKSDKQIVTAAQRYAVKAAKDQGAVWSEVGKSKAALTANASKMAGRKVDVEANASPTSLQLALESPELATAAKDLRDGAAKALADRSDAIGVAYAINGKLVNAEVYGSARLFAKLRDKVLEAAATEAIAELKDDVKEAPPTSDNALLEFLRVGTIEGSRLTKPNAQTEWREHEVATRALYESRDSDFKKVWCHRNVIVADESVKAAARAPSTLQNHSIEANTLQQNRQETAPARPSPR